MDPGASELDSSLPHSENPCLIVEDSQPDSVALEDDPESSYRALLARRLSSLQPASRSPVLELISSPPGSKHSQSDGQSESSQRNNQEKPDTLNEPNSESQQESQVLNICPPLNKKCAPEDMESGADSTTHCVQAEGGTSQFSFLELSQSEDLGDEVTNCQEEEDNITPQPDCEKHAIIGQNSDSRTSESEKNKAVRSEVSSSSSLDSPVQSAQQVSVQVLLHSHCLQTSEQDCEILSSQQDLFEADKTGTAVDSTVSEPEHEGQPTPTPGQSLRLLHLSGQGTLVQESLSQSSIDFVAPSQNSFTNTPFIVPSSPTGTENEPSTDEPMDTSLPPEDRVREKEEPMDTETASKPRPSASTPVSQNSPGFTLEGALSVPSQPEFSHNVFVPTQSQEASSQLGQKPPSESQRLDSCPFSLPLQLSVNTESSSTAQQNSQHVEEDSQATQIEELEEPPGVDTSDSVTEPTNKTSIVPRLQTSTSSQISCADEVKVHSESAENSRLNVQQEDVKARSSAEVVSCSERMDSSDVTVSSCVQETPSNSPPCGLTSPSSIPPTAAEDPMTSSASRGEKTAERPSVESSSQISVTDGAQKGNEQGAIDECEEEVMEEECTVSGETSGVVLVLSQSQLLTPEPMEEDSVVVVTDSEQDSEVLQKDAVSQVPTSSSQPVRGTELVSTNGHEPQVPAKQAQVVSSRMSQGEEAGPDAEGLKDKILSDSSGDISFHFTLPKEGDLIGPVTGATPPLINQLKQTVRHSTPIEISPFAEKSDAAGDVSADVVMAASAIVPGDSGENTAEKEDGKLSLRMKLVTPVDEVNSDRFSLQKPSLPEEDGAAVKESTVASVVTSPSVFSRVRQVHRQKEEEDGAMSVRGELFASPVRSSQASSLGCNSLPNSQAEVLQQEVLALPQESQKDPAGPAEQAEDALDPLRPPETASVKADARQKVSQQTFDQSSTCSPTNKLRQRTNSSTPGLHSPGARSETESPSTRRIPGPSHRRHVRTIKEVRTTITRIITDVYYEDGKEVERKVSEESEEPVVDCQVLDSDVSPCRTGSSSVTSGDLGDISSLSSKASSLQHSSGGTSSSTGLTRPDFLRPSSRGAKSARGGGHSLQRVSARLPSSSDDEIYTRVLPPQSPPDTELHGQSDSLRSEEEEEEEEEEVGSPPGSSFVGLRVVAKWSSNGYFYSGRIMKDAGEGRFRLRFDDGYECEVAGKDILLCDPIPLETEVTALLEDEYFSIGVVRGHKTEGQELFYSVEKDGQRQWYNRKAVILSLEQGNKLREQHSLGPYEPSPPLAKASDISLDNLVEGKRRRRGASENTPNRSSSSSPRTPGPSGKRKLMTSEGSRTPAKRGRRGARAAQQRVGLCNTSGSGTDLPNQSGDVVKTHGPLPQNASLFMGFAFMMTASSESDRLSNKLSSDEEEEYVQTGPYNKTYTESQLQAGGGFILPDFNEEQCKAAYQSLLIADQHCRTQKYLLCLASGVPCVSHLWVRDCCKDNKLLNYRNYLLPAGMGPDDAIVEWHPRCSPFKALRVLLVFEKPNELWAQLITMGGASSVRHVQPDASDIPAGKFDVAVTDHSCPALLEKNMASQQVPLVSAEWLIQSVICGECLGFHSLPRYRHNYTL